MPKRLAKKSLDTIRTGVAGPCVLTINGGSSSIKFALYRVAPVPARVFSGKIERIDLSKPVLTIHAGGPGAGTHPIAAGGHREAGALLIQWLEEHIGFKSVAGIGHRVVHGGPQFTESQRVGPRLVKALRRLSPYDPEHLPAGIQIMEVFHERHPRTPQVACFDTAFHRTMPRVARLLPLPRRLDAAGVQRFGFHGLSYTYLMAELRRLAGAKTANGRVILAHLGNGASLAAVRGGQSLDTSMGFTPAAGIPMSTRSGDLDPGLVWYLERTQHMTAKQFHVMVHYQSGLLGVSGLSPDMRDLLEAEAKNVPAAEAVALFCYQTKKWIGSFAAALGGLDTLVFAGGIGENAAPVRARICEGLEFLGLRLDAKRNLAAAAVISTPASRVTVRIIRTDEEAVIASEVMRVLELEGATSKKTIRPVSS
ncbi:Acetate kinase [Verrucomicrobia bacterium]|nr:Acetate kinase [Verrucomicrobiota bacterium]